MISLDVARDELVTRLVNRGKEQGRTDDTPEVIENRIRVYEEQTTPVMDFYKAQGKYRGIDGMGSIGEIFDRIMSILES